jgi:hypothetical protein
VIGIVDLGEEPVALELDDLWLERAAVHQLDVYDGDHPLGRALVVALGEPRDVRPERTASVSDEATKARGGTTKGRGVGGRAAFLERRPR